ncbi:MAG: CPBP family intramembrane metalloprotease [Spirochaetaceae bacterium]
MNTKLKNILLLVFWLVVIFIGTQITIVAFSFITRFILVRLGLFDELSGFLPRILSIAVIITFVSIYFRYVKNENFKIHAFGNQKLIFQDSLFGIIGTIIVLTSIYTVLTMNKWLIVSGWMIDRLTSQQLIRPVALALVTSLTAAVGEEVLFRGFFQKRLEQILKKPFNAFWISASIFSLVHFFVSSSNEGNTIILFICILIAGMLFSYLYYKTESLILPIALHFTYDFFVEDFFNLPGKNIGPTLYGAITESTLPNYITGTEYGIETGLCGVVVWIFLFILFTRYTRYRRKGMNLEIK